MTTSKLFACAGSAALSLACVTAAFADDQPTATAPPTGGSTATAATASPPPPPSPPPYPSMGPTLSNNANSATFDAGPLGKLTVNGVLTGVAYAQSNPSFEFGDFKFNSSTGFDLSNGMATVQQTSGIVQFAVQAGVYSFPTVGNAYIKATTQTPLTFGYAPVAFVKIVPNSEFSLQVGQLPTLIGAELPFTYENANIERGLLWNQEPLISRGIQGNFTKGPFTVSLSWNDGYYSNQYTTISGLITYTLKNSDTLTFAASGNTSKNFTSPCFAGGGCLVPFATPIGQQQGQIYNLIFNHTMGKWTFTPYVQYNSVPNDSVTGASGSMWGGALIAKYSFTPEISVAGRVEYEASAGAFNMTFFGPRSNAWSLTVTPTYQKGIFFARADVSYVSVGSGTPGDLFGHNFDQSNQVRGFLETGVIF